MGSDGLPLPHPQHPQTSRWLQSQGPDIRRWQEEACVFALSKGLQRTKRRQGRVSLHKVKQKRSNSICSSLLLEPFCLEQHLQSQLQLSRRKSGGDLAEVAIGGPQIEPIEVRPVEDVEGICLELEAGPFSNRKILRQ